MKTLVTSHAIERFCERVMPGCSDADASWHLTRALQSGAPVKQRSVNGQDMIKMSNPRCFVVVERDPGQLVAVTVLNDETQDDAVDPDEEQAALEMVSANSRIQYRDIESALKEAHISLAAYKRKEQAAGNAMRAAREHYNQALQNLASRLDMVAKESFFEMMKQAERKATP